jgi:H+/Cl- antiporter ClcA
MTPNRLKEFARATVLALLVGLLAGLAATLFLYSLDAATKARLSHPYLIWFLPLAGLLIGWIFHRFGREIIPGNNLILDEIHDPKKTIPFRMAPFILIGTVLTHLFGGSAGREGTAVQMGASLADQVSHYFRLALHERKALLVAGAGAGFGAAIGTPFAGVLFGIEVMRIGKLQAFAVWESLVAALFAYSVSVLLWAPHSFYPRLTLPTFAWRNLLGVLLVAICSGLMAWLFVKITHLIEVVEQRWLPKPEWKPFFAGIVIVGLYQFINPEIYAGLGIPVIQEALRGSTEIQVPFVKALMTALTVGSGFKGGEFIPLVFIGTTLGSATAVVLHAHVGLLASVGFAAVFGAASNTPIACSVMAMEVFGFDAGLYFVLGCLIAYFCSGRATIYRSQPSGKKMWWYPSINFD